MDFPRAWEIARSVEREYHHNRCSYNVTDGGVLCDCRVLTAHPEYAAADQPHPTPEADRCGASWNSNPVVSWTCGLPKGHEGAHLSLASPERFQGPEYMRMGS